MSIRRASTLFISAVLASALGIAFGSLLAISGTAVAAAVADAQAGDALITLLQATGFPTWAIVVAVMGKQVINQLKDISERLDRHVTQTENRLARLEEAVRLRASYRSDNLEPR